MPALRSRAGWRLSLSLLVSMLSSAVHPGEALAQGGAALRSQGQQVQRAIQNQIRQAVIPRLVIRQAIAGPVKAVALQEERGLLATILGNDTVRLWDLGRGYQEQDFSGRVPGARAVAIAPSGLRLAIGTQQGSIVIFDRTRSTPLVTLSGHAGPVAVLSFSRDGGLLASAGADGTARLWDIATGRERLQLRGHEGAVTAITVSADGQLLLTGGADGTVRLWSAVNGQQLRSARTVSGSVTAAIFGAGDQVAVAGSDGSVQLSRDRLATAPGRLGMHAQPVITLGYDGPQGRLVSADSGGAVKFWDIASLQLRQEVQLRGAQVTAVAFGTAAGRVFAAAADGATRVWDGRTGTSLAQLITMANGWAVIDEAGRFDGSQEGVGDIDWATGSASLNLDNFSASYYEPGLLPKLLTGVPLANPNAAPVGQGFQLPPRLRVESDGVNAQAGQPFAVTVTAENQGGGIGAVTLFQNGKAVPATALTSDQPGTSGSDPTRTQRYRLVATAGRNELRAVGASLQGIEGEAGQFAVDAAGTTPRPTLHIAAIGINDYVNPAFRLRYAAPDARAVEQRLANSGGLFEAVRDRSLYDRDATRAGILAVLASLHLTAPQDVVVLYLAGHGITVGNEWYFLAADLTDVGSTDQVVRYGISSADLEAAVAGMGAQHIVLIIDACKSGGLVTAFSDGTDKRALRTAARIAGIHILAATQVEQDAPEFDSLGHGAFTYVVLQGLSGQASLGAGLITASGMLHYTERTAPAFTRQQLETIVQRMLTARGGSDLISQIRSFPVPVPVAYSRGEDFPVSTAR